MDNSIKMKEYLKAGDPIYFLRTLDKAACDEHPGCTYASKGQHGIITKIGDCKEGYWVQCKGYPAFGCERKDFELIELTEELYIKELQKFTSTDPERVHINTIKKHEDYAVATDGIAMSFTQKTCTDTLDKTDIKDSLSKIINRHNTATFKPFTMPPLNIKLCKKCNGSGMQCLIDCPECSGDGCLSIKSDYNTYEVACKSCNGNGTQLSKNKKNLRPCNTACIHGMEFDEYMMLENGLINPCYLKMIENYPDLEIAALDFESPGSKVYHFKSSNGIHVVIMGTTG